MAKPFRLQAVVKLRESRRDAARADLADAMRAVDVLAEQRQAVEQRYAELTEQRRLASERADTAWLLNAGRYELVLRADEASLAEQTAKVEQEIVRRRAVLAEAEREVRALEVLRERELEREKKIAAKREAKALDEFASRRRSASDSSPQLTP